MNRLIFAGSPERFSFQWQRYTDYKPLHERQFREWTAALPFGSWEGRDVLDIGCGMARNSISAIRAGARSLLAVDVDPQTVEVARRNLSPYANATVRAGSAYDEGDGSFDVVMCIGVLHHLAEPRRALQSMLTQVRPGGSLVLWVYGSQGPARLHRAVSLIRVLTSRLPTSLVWHLSGPIAWVVRTFFLRQSNGRSIFGKRLLEMDSDDARVFIFDQLIPRIARYYSRQELELFLEAAVDYPMEITEVNNLSWSVRVDRLSR